VEITQFFPQDLNRSTKKKKERGRENERESPTGGEITDRKQLALI
jgi:hypothetical protein